MTNLKLPLLSSPEVTLRRWGSELRPQSFVTEEDLLSARWVDWEPTISSSMTLSALDVQVARYLKISGLVKFQIKVTFTTGGVASPLITFTLPSDLVTMDDSGLTFACSLVDATSIAGTARASSTGGVVNVRRYDGGNWGLGASREFRVVGEYDTLN